MIRILVVEDSAVQREALIYLLEEAGGFEIIGTARDGIEGVTKTEQLRPDIVLMDCHMPRADGIQATRSIMERCPVPIVMTSATTAPDETEFVFEAMRSGALAVIAKPIGLEGPESQQQANEALRILRLMSDVKVVGRRANRLSLNGLAAATPASAEPSTIRVVGIAGSTGAPGVVADILAAIGPALPVPILIVQHIAKGFVGGLVEWLGHRTGFPVQLAQHGMPLVPGTAYVAPDEVQMGVDPQARIRLVEDAPEDEGFRPSANYLFRSLARTYGSQAMGVLLTGMGRDGASGLLELHANGGLTAAQDEATSIVFGMPGEAVRLGAASKVLPPAEIARLIVSATALKSAAYA